MNFLKHNHIKTFLSNKKLVGNIDIWGKVHMDTKTCWMPLPSELIYNVDNKWYVPPPEK